MKTSTKFALLGLFVGLVISYFVIHERGVNEQYARCRQNQICPVCPPEKACPICPTGEPCPATIQKTVARKGSRSVQRTITTTTHGSSVETSKPAGNSPCPCGNEASPKIIEDPSYGTGRPSNEQARLSEQQQREQTANAERIRQETAEQEARKAAYSQQRVATRQQQTEAEQEQAGQQQQSQGNGHSTRDAIIAQVTSTGVAVLASRVGAYPTGYAGGQRRYEPDGNGGYIDRLYPMAGVQSRNLNIVGQQSALLDAPADWYHRRAQERRQ